jgi:hypothetical protein
VLGRELRHGWRKRDRPDREGRSGKKGQSDVAGLGRDQCAQRCPEDGMAKHRNSVLRSPKRCPSSPAGIVPARLPSAIALVTRPNCLLVNPQSTS